MTSLNVGNLGEYLREQRRNAQLSLRQLADAAGVSNPYLSQIERGLRKPSAEVLQQVAKALRISAETLYVRAGILDAERDRDEVETRAAILADPTLNERQKQVLLQIYESFRKENGFEITQVDEGDQGVGADVRHADVQYADVHIDQDSDLDIQDSDLDISDAEHPRSAADTGVRGSRTTDGSDADPQQTAS
ncbi:helix-turn-helix domain-containing protein [Streptomyces sp. NPDC058470]|uniref:helix-turn-helix domain-containing protein n=1 Tax=Streptomyces sp. NPDC058470 TaxID=3346515 RepID=UPI003649B225